jgi:hypothetical protein
LVGFIVGFDWGEYLSFCGYLLGAGLSENSEYVGVCLVSNGDRYIADYWFD